MDQGREPGRETAPRAAAVLAAGAAIVLLAMAAAGSGASPFGGGAAGGRARAPDQVVWGLLLTLLLVVLVAGIAGLVLAIIWREGIELPKRGRWRLRGALMLLALVLLAMWWQSARDRAEVTEPGAPATPSPGADVVPGAGLDSAGWVPILVATAVLVLWLGTGMLAQARRRRPAPGPSEAERLAALVEEALLDLAAETDPRRAVIAAYDVMERGLAAAGLPRRPGETPLEHTTRVLLEASVPPPPVTVLAALFERARFSPHPVDQAMRDQALAALGQVRAALRDRAAAELPGPA